MAKTLVYQLYPRSWQGLAEMEDFLYQIAELDVDYVWLSPLYPSPGYDHGYDISDYQDIDPRFGSMHDFDCFVETAHNLGMGVLMDLVLNHTSTKHEWFNYHPEYYCWSKTDRPGWRNLFNGDSAWQYYEQDGEYYLHLFHEEQADLNWFPEGSDGDINQELVKRFREIIDFWTLDHLVDGFRLDIPQSINKDFARDTLEIKNLLYGDKAAKVLNAVFGGGSKDLFLMMECVCSSPADGLVDYYTRNTPVDFVLDVSLKDKAGYADEVDFFDLVKEAAAEPHFMLDLESHDSPRLPSRGIDPADGIWCMFNSGAEAICLYQGQELGLTNPTEEQLPDHKLVDLDAQTKMRFRQGALLQDLRPLSRSNARVPLPLDEYEKQDPNPSSYLNLTKDWIARWRDSEDSEEPEE
ncbi:hypothetical protein IKF89_00805 [Candidatus Saccharibacteria bacterium]|nr:hypothetical protein [Candidatus Saccharibacteria bacterium]